MEEESLNARITLETNMSLKFLLKILPKNNNNNRISENLGLRGYPFKMTPYHFPIFFFKAGCIQILYIGQAMRLSKPTTNIRRPSLQQRRGLRLRLRLRVRLWEEERIWRGQPGRCKEEPKRYQVKEEGLRCDHEGDDQLTKKVMVLGLMKRRFRWWPSWWCCPW